MKIITSEDQELPIQELENCLLQNKSFIIADVLSFNLIINELKQKLSNQNKTYSIAWISNALKKFIIFFILAITFVLFPKICLLFIAYYYKTVFIVFSSIIWIFISSIIFFKRKNYSIIIHLKKIEVICNHIKRNK